jgi:hypothetical protein
MNPKANSDSSTRITAKREKHSAFKQHPSPKRNEQIPTTRC